MTREGAELLALFLIQDGNISFVFFLESEKSLFKVDTMLVG